ncbi:MAG: Uma2 family endonuclease [Candidatus Eremiobacterota bacterium]
MTMATRPFSRTEYYLMVDHGMFHGERVELIEGHILALSPHNPTHSNAVTHTTGVLVRALGEDYLVRVQLPVSLGERSEPEPDFAVVTEAMLHSNTRHPSRPLLVMEVANSSLAYDRTEKASLYARYGIRDYWVLNLIDRHLECCRNPVEAPQAEFGFDYAERTLHLPDQTVSPLRIPEVRILVSRLF